MRHVPHVLVPGPWEGDRIEPGGDRLHHLTRVLRLGEGADLSYTDGAGRTGQGRLAAGAILRGPERSVARPTPEVSVAVAPPRARARQRFLVEKLAELGVDRLYWLTARLGIGRPPRPDRASAWAAAALEQSRGAWLMEILGPVAVAQLPKTPTLYVTERESLQPPSVVEGGILVVGPEAGLAEGDVPSMAHRVSLGARVLRVETAAVVGATVLLERSGRLSR